MRLMRQWLLVAPIVIASFAGPGAAHAQDPWTVSLTPTLNPLPVGFCGAVQLTVFDASGSDVPRNPAGFRVTMADFDLTVSGASVAGRRIDGTHFEACACQGGMVGGEATVTASYPAEALDARARVADVKFERSATFTLAAPRGASDPPACVAAATAAAASAAAPPAATSRPLTDAASSRRQPATPAPVVAPPAVGLAPGAIPVSAIPDVPPEPTARARTDNAPFTGERLPDAPAPSTAIGNPTDVKAVQTGAAEVFLTWRPVQGSNPDVVVVGYAVFGPGSTGQLMTVPAFTASGVPLGAHQWLVGTVVRAFGTLQAAPYADWSPVNLEVVAGTWRANPSGFSAVQTGAGEVLLTWQPVTGLRSYTIRGAGLPVNGAVVAAGATTFTVSGLPTGSHQWNLSSLYFDPPFTTPATEFPVAAANIALWPVNPAAASFTAVQTAPGEVQLSWQPVTGVSFYGLFGPGLSAVGEKLSGTTTTFTARSVPAGQQQWSVGSFYEPGNVSTAIAAFPTVALNVTAAAGSPAASSPAAPAPASSRYLVSVTGLRAYQASVDDVLSRDGRGDEVYVAAYVRRYNRLTGELAESTNRESATYGDVANFGAQRFQAGSSSGTGGIQDGDSIPDGALVATRSAPVQEIAYPWKLWDGTLTDSTDVLIITPSLWEQDTKRTLYDLWKQQQLDLNSALLIAPSVQQQIAQKTFGALVSGASGTGGGTAVGGQLRIAADFAMVSFGLPIYSLISASNDRPIGLLANGPDQAMLPNHAIVLTREIIEAALALPALGVIPSPIANLSQNVLSGVPPLARLGVAAPLPGIMVIQFEDRNMPGFLAIPERPAIYQMFIQVERMP